MCIYTVEQSKPQHEKMIKYNALKVSGSNQQSSWFFLLMIVSTVIMRCNKDNLIVTFNSPTKLKTINEIETLPKFRNSQCQLNIY